MIEKEIVKALARLRDIDLTLRPGKVAVVDRRIDRAVAVEVAKA